MDASANTLSLIIAIIATSAWLVIAIWALIERSRALERARIAGAEAFFNRILIDSGPNAFMLAHQDGQLFCSDRLREWLELEHPIYTADDFRNAGSGAGLNQRDVEKLLENIRCLSADGRPFSHRINLSGGQRLISATGRRAKDAESGGHFDLVWFQDASVDRTALSAAEKRLAEIEKEHRWLTDAMSAAPFPIWLRDRNLDLKFVNKAYAAAVEAGSAEEAVNNRVELLSDALEGSARDAAVRALEQSKAVHSRHFAVIDGQRRALNMIDAPLAGDDVGTVGFAIDITEQEEVKSELLRYLDSHSETLNKLSTPVAIFASDKTLQFFNSAFASLWELPEEWLEEHPHHSEVLEAMRERRKLPEQANFLAWKQEVLSHYTGLLEPLEEMWHLPDGTALRVVTQPHPLGGLLVLFEDMTDRLILERSYNTLIAVQRETLDHLYEAVAVFGSDGCLKLHNPNYAKIWQLSEDDLAGEPHISSIIDNSKPLLSTAAGWPLKRNKLLGQVMDRQRMSGRFTRPDGMILEYAIVPLPDGAVLITYVDVTDTYHIEQALRDRNEALETADRLKSQFIANMSYELRTPLNSIIGFTELLDQEYFGPLNQKQAEYTESVLFSAHELKDMINDVLDLAVIEAGAMELELCEIDIAEIIQNVAVMVTEHARKERVKIRVKSRKPAGMIKGDIRLIRQALYNLMTNAITYTPPGGTVTLQAQGTRNTVELAVSDTGIGIGLDEQEKVFEKFHTGEGSSEGHGAGLGLALVRSFIELHNGKVSLVSEPEKGTTVTCMLPRNQPVPQKRSNRSPRPAADGEHKDEITVE